MEEDMSLDSYPASQGAGGRERMESVSAVEADDEGSPVKSGRRAEPPAAGMAESGSRKQGLPEVETEAGQQQADQGLVPPQSPIQICGTTPVSKNSTPQQHGEGSKQSTPSSGGKAKRKHRRGKSKGGNHHRKWKPYDKLTWEEKRILSEKETLRACQKREQRFASGQPMAPYNTTQFLMEQHKQATPEFAADENPGPNNHNRDNNSGGSVDSSDEYYDSPNDEEIFLEREFSEVYENFHVERLQTMTKDDLVKEYLELEGKVDRMEQRLRTLEQNQQQVQEAQDQRLTMDESLDVARARDLEEEIRKLRQENQKLSTENDTLKTMAAKSTCELKSNCEL